MTDLIATVAPLLLSMYASMILMGGFAMTLHNEKEITNLLHQKIHNHNRCQGSSCDLGKGAQLLINTVSLSAIIFGMSLTFLVFATVVMNVMKLI